MENFWSCDSAGNSPRGRPTYDRPIRVDDLELSEDDARPGPTPCPGADQGVHCPWFEHVVAIQVLQERPTGEVHRTVLVAVLAQLLLVSKDSETVILEGPRDLIGPIRAGVFSDDDLEV